MIGIYGPNKTFKWTDQKKKKKKNNKETITNNISEKESITTDSTNIKKDNKGIL